MLLASALLAAATAALPVEAPPADAFGYPVTTLEACDALLARFPRSFEAAICYVRMSWKDGKLRSRQEATAHLERRVAARPGDYLARYQLGVLLLDDGELDRAEPHLRAAGEGARADRHAEAEVWARTAQSIVLCADGRLSEGEIALARAVEAASGSPEPDLLTLAWIWSGSCAFYAAEYGRAVGLYQEARARIARSPRTWRTSWLETLALGRLADVLGQLGRHREAFELQQRLVEQLSLAYPKAAARHGVAVSAQRLADLGELPREEADRLLHEALDAEVKAGVRLWLNGGEAYTRLLLARRLGPGDAAEAEAERALELARRDRDKRVIGEALRLLAVLRAQRKPDRAPAAVAAADEAVDLARSSGLRQEEVRGLLARAWVLWHLGRREAAARASGEAVDALDRFRALQPDQQVRARAAADLDEAFSLLVAAPLEAGASPEDLALAFGVAERLRARALLDELAATRASAVPPALAEREAALQGELSQAHRRLLSGVLDDGERAAALQGLERLEERQAALRDAVARATSLPGATTEAPITLQVLQAALGPDEAWLGFEVWGPAVGGTLPDVSGSSWLLVVTAGAARAIRIPDAPALAAQIELFGGLLARRDGSEEPGAVRLYGNLLAEALAGLPRGVRRLWLAPDGPLYRLPFGALREARGARPLAARFELALAPSAALLLHWRRQQFPAAQVPLLALADPQGPAATPGSETRGATPGPAGLGPLPFARAEALSAVGVLGRGSSALLGPEASEAALKARDLRGTAILHFATHALVDDARPERSALLLAAGAPEEDGLLHVSEVATLHLSGATVVLAACRSTSGAVLHGEGLLGLTRAFLQAGAHTVVGSLWPLRDDESAQLFELFYSRLAEGLPVATALAEATRARAAEGAPTAAWAGMVVLGDGARTFSGSEAPPGSSLRKAAMAAAVALAALVLLLRARRRDWIWTRTRGPR